VTFKEVMAQVLAWLQQDQRISYRALKRQSLNLSEFVGSCSWSIKTGLHRSKTCRFPRYGLDNDTA
jgi:hypothetical protein